MRTHTESMLPFENINNVPKSSYKIKKSFKVLTKLDLSSHRDQNSYNCAKHLKINPPTQTNQTKPKHLKISFPKNTTISLILASISDELVVDFEKKTALLLVSGSCSFDFDFDFPSKVWDSSCSDT